MAKHPVRNSKHSPGEFGEHLELELRRIELLARIAAGEKLEEEWKKQEANLREYLKGMEISTPLNRLRERLSLSELEMEALLITAGASLSPDLNGLYAKLRESPLQTAPTPGLIARLLSLSFAETSELLNALLTEGPLSRLRIFYAEPRDSAEPFISTPLVCSRSLLRFMLSPEAPSPLQYGEFLDTGIALAEMPLETGTREALKAIEAAFAEEKPGRDRNLILHFSGPHGAGKKEAAAGLCHGLGIKALHVGLKNILNEGVDPARIIEEVCREAYIRGTALVFSDWQAMDDFAGQGDRRHAFIARARMLSTPLFITSSPRSDFEFEHKDQLVELEFKAATRRTRERIWSNYLNGMQIAESLTPDYLAGAFNFTPGRIQAAFEYARNQEKLLKGNLQISEEQLLAGCRVMSNRNLSKLATRVEHRFEWNDLVLPDEMMEQLRDIPDHLRHGRIVHEQWRLDLKSTGGRGLNALFSGPSGTGKTMAASIIAGDLKLEMYRVDLSSIISKYVGETEKNLGKIFAEAEGSNAILFFDEADSLFGKRGEVKDAHDRYANTEVNYLLQKMEEFQGITILATNLRENIDDSFLRRLHFIIEFPFPGIQERTRIWRGVFSPETPLDKNVDADFLGRTLKIPGGNIMSIARNAAFLAAAEGRPVGMNQILRAAKREFEKEGRPFLPSELGRYRDYLSL